MCKNIIYNYTLLVTNIRLFIRQTKKHTLFNAQIVRSTRQVAYPRPSTRNRVPVSTPRDVSSSETESDELASGRVSFVAGRRIESWEQ